MDRFLAKIPVRQLISSCGLMRLTTFELIKRYDLILKLDTNKEDCKEWTSISPFLAPLVRSSWHQEVGAWVASDGNLDCSHPHNSHFRDKVYVKDLNSLQDMLALVALDILVHIAARPTNFIQKLLVLEL